MFLNAVDDFKNRTLKALPSLFEKLAYVCSLRGKDRTYKHWGLIKAFGEPKANEAIGMVHAAMATEIVKTPIREVYRQFESAESVNADSLVLNAPPNGDELLSDHLRLIQNSVKTIADQERSSPPGA